MNRYSALLSAPLPEDWQAKESITLLPSSGEANVIASSEPVPEVDVDTDRYAEIQGDLLRKEFPGYQERSFEQTRAFGRGTGWLRRFEWTPPDGVRIMQIQLYYVEAGRGFTATATSPASHFARFEEEFRDVLAGLRIDPEAFRFDPGQTPWPAEV
jgi:hypothetical protein